VLAEMEKNAPITRDAIQQLLNRAPGEVDEIIKDLVGPRGKIYPIEENTYELLDKPAPPPAPAAPEPTPAPAANPSPPTEPPPKEGTPWWEKKG
jgi:hypothetical protein